MQRYYVKCDNDMIPYHEPSSGGEWVRYDEAQAEIERLTKTVENCRHDFRIALKRAEKAEAERDEARAQVAMAYEAAAKTCSLAATSYLGKGADTDLGSRSRAICDVACRIRALIPDDAKAALEAYGREKVREGMRRASVIGNDLPDAIWDQPWSEYEYGIANLQSAILDEMEKLK